VEEKRLESEVLSVEVTEVMLRPGFPGVMAACPGVMARPPPEVMARPSSERRLARRALRSAGLRFGSASAHKRICKK
jgi:hypothetical protein